MRVLALAAVVATMSAGPFGEVLGDVRVGDEYVADAAVALKCGAEVVKGRTDKRGSFRLSAKASGKCTLSVTHDGQSPSVDVVVFEAPARYRLLLEQKDGTWTLRRV